VLTEAAMLAPVPARPGTFQTLSVASETPWRIALSSGTTGRSKAVAWTHGASLACWPTTVEPFAPMAETDRVLVFMDISNTFAIHRILRVFGGAATLVLPLNASPQELVRCIDLYGATQVITVTSLAVKLLAHLQQQPGKPGLRFHALNLLLVGGEPISQPAHRALRSRVCPNLVVTYGTSECGPIATADADLLCANPRATGRLLPATQAQALSDSGEALPPGQLGRLRFRTPGMVTAYLGDPDKSAEAFVDGWYQSRDMGFVDEAGIVWLGARSEEWLALGTETIDPQRLEAVISALPGVREAVVFLATQTGTPPVLVALYAAEGPIATAQVRQHCIDQLDARLVPDYFGQVNEIPRTANGKISRRELGQRFKVDAKPDAATAVAAPPAA
jgi:acyl-coenzyme A synthetase/AMP-(fatty) acid ligase